jgi:hypothetical protein
MAVTEMKIDLSPGDAALVYVENAVSLPWPNIVTKGGCIITPRRTNTARPSELYAPSPRCINKALSSPQRQSGDK